MEFGIFNKLLNALKRIPTQTLIYQGKVVLSTCCLCGTPPQRYPLLCDYCLNDLPQFNYPLVENDLLNWPAVNKILPQHTFDHLFALSPHCWPCSHWVSLLKYHGRFDLADLLGQLLFDQWNDSIATVNGSAPTLIVSVPLHIKKWQFRGYNQAHLIAKHFAKTSNIEYAQNAVSRLINTDSQVGKTGANRRKNMKNAFELNSNITWPKHVLIIDDVVTTGTTFNELSSLLKHHGVEKVTVLSITIALPNT